MAGAVLFFVILFGLWVRSVPPRKPTPKITIPPQGGVQQGVPDFMNVQVDPSLSEEEAKQAALEQAIKMMKEQEGAGAAEGEPVDSTVGSEQDEGEVEEL